MGILAIAQTAGINLTTFNVLAGAIVIGVGFGLQNVINNFVSGLIIIFERPIRVGDRVDIAGVEGSIEDIGTRRITILTNDNISIIVPNQRFLTDNVIKLPNGTMPIRLRIPIAVKSGADPRVVERLLLEAARESPDVLEQPPPAVRLLAVTGNLAFELHVWNSKLIRSRDQLVSALNFAILEKLARAEIATA